MKLCKIFTLTILLTARIGICQIDPTVAPVVYQQPGMDKVGVQKDIVYKTF